MDSDTLACQQNDTMFIVWMRHLDQYKTERMAAKLAYDHVGRLPVDAMHHSQGSFNRCYRVKFKQGPDVLVRFPALGRSMFRREKVEDEITVLEYIAQNTSIPVPRVLGNGISVVGPYIVMEFIEGKILSEYLRASQERHGPSTLNLDLETATLRQAYRVMANVLLKLSRCQFPAIGGLVKNSGGFSVKKRAMTFNTNELVSMGNFPPKRLCQNTFQDANTYLVSLANEHFNHLETQRNDAIIDEDDCRKKYIARCLFREVVRQYSKTHSDGPFILFCDDLRPSNVIVDDDLNIRAVIDWEYSYVAPAEFSYCSPWWLLLARPESWADGFDDYLKHYIPRQKIFLEELRECEKKCEKELALESPYLSDRMAQSLENGDFWIFCAATYSFVFDDIYWVYIHPKHYGSFKSMEDIKQLLREDEQKNLESFVEEKMRQMKEASLDSHRTLQEMTDA